MAGYGVILAVSALASWLLTFAARRLAVRCGVIEALSDRKVHKDPTPTAGGAAMFVAFLAAMAAASRMGTFRDVFQRSTEPLGVDDIREVSAPAKVAGQVFAGSVLYLFGVTMFFFQVPFAGFISLSADLEPLLTVAWVCVITNAVNLIDGLDGLAAGIVAIAAEAERDLRLPEILLQRVDHGGAARDHDRRRHREHRGHDRRLHRVDLDVLDGQRLVGRVEDRCSHVGSLR